MKTSKTFRTVKKMPTIRYVEYTFPHRISYFETTIKLYKFVLYSFYNVKRVLTTCYFKMKKIYSQKTNTSN